MLTACLLAAATVAVEPIVVQRKVEVIQPARVRFYSGYPTHDRDQAIARQAVEEFAEQLYQQGILQRPVKQVAHQVACVKCHQKSEGAPDWDRNLTGDQITDALIAISEGRMPKGRNLSPADRQAVVQSLLHSRSAQQWSDSSSPPASSPPVSPQPPTTQTPTDSEAEADQY